jgi:hypothetical protein
MAAFAFGTMALLVSPTHAEETLLLKKLLAKEMKLINAIQAKDKATLQEMLAHQKYCVEPGKGRLQTEALFDLFDNTELTSFTITNAKATTVGDRGAILSYRYNWKGTENGKPVELVSFATSVWEQNDGDWRSVFYQETAVDD